MFKHLITLIFFIVYPIFSAYSQQKSDKITPSWIHKPPIPSNSSFTYKTITSEALSIENARNLCLQELVSEVDMKNGMVIISDKHLKINSAQAVTNGIIKESASTDFSSDTKIKTESVQMHICSIDEYWTKGKDEKYRLTLLYAYSKPGVKPMFDRTELTTSYASDPATWGLALIPGAAQFHKGSYLKGGLVLGGSVALAGGALACGLMRKDNMAKYENAHNTSVKEQYRTRINGLNTGMYCCIGGLAALYIYNIIDAIVAPGARRIIVYPAASTDGSVGLGATVKF